MKRRKIKLSHLFFLFTCFGTLVAVILSILIVSGVFKQEVTETQVKEVETVDANNLFLGDSLTAYFDLEAAFPDAPVINSGIAGNTTTDILNDIENRAYIYNPSTIFLCIGTNDLRDGKSVQEVYDSIVQIIESLQENRPLAKIVLESLYPVNSQIGINTLGLRSNEDIQEINAKLKAYAKDQDLTYVDLYDDLVDDQGNLDAAYTVDGLHLSDAGYQVVTQGLQTYLDT